ncbi:AraC family transcriptional regulator [Azospirillum sp. YIM B02556]|uniref:AraC family transcriptional regulator n=1 Tax=Azospirillum endophyticum TaxID=2800326 RepID=A0ABS1F1B0_9PROT|nr:AraC family transcriptional regulator [Azospirillum endophyticum]MBK1837205.1 AraC family transcriptional regulator [Azospirillum endophyticum]
MFKETEFSLILDRVTSNLGDGVHETRIPRLAVIRASSPTERLHTVYEPSVCFVAQGAKRSIAGDRILEYRAGQYLAVSLDLPAIGQVTEASAESPYLCFRLTLDPVLLSGLILEAGLKAPPSHIDQGLGLTTSLATPDMIDAAARMARLLETPDAIPVLAPLVERELLYRLLTADHGALLHRIATGESHTAQIGRAVKWIKDNFREPLRIEAVAAKANMSPSAFHQHFKDITALSPLQYQKQLRLQEARRLILANLADAASAGFAVGYGSPSQFSREYARLFGLPPIRDAARLRSTMTADHAGARQAAQA